MRTLVYALLVAAAAAISPVNAANPQFSPSSGLVELHDYVFDDGEKLPQLKLHYLTIGTPRRDADGAITNAVLLLHGTSGSAGNFVQPAFFDALYGAGEPLDLSRYYLVIPDGIGAGDSSKPSDGLHAHFPRYGYKDQVRTQHLLLQRLGIKHLRLVLGTSMGGMQTWLWGEMFPNDMDGLVAIASTPAAISGRNMVWREIIIQAIRSDPGWKGGDYPKDSPPKAWIKTAIPLFTIMTGTAEQMQKQAPSRRAALDLVARLEAHGEAFDANDFLYAFESSADYDPAPKLGAIVKPMLTINFADDLINPPDLLHLPTAPNFVEVLLPAGSGTYGHMTLAHPAVWASAVRSFLLQHVPHER